MCLPHTQQQQLCNEADASVRTASPQLHPPETKKLSYRWWALKEGGIITGSVTDGDKGSRLNARDRCDPCNVGPVRRERIYGKEYKCDVEPLNYPRYCVEASSSTKIFDQFRQDYQRFAYAGIEVCGLWNYNQKTSTHLLLKHMNNVIPHFSKYLPQIALVDKIGNGTTFSIPKPITIELPPFFAPTNNPNNQIEVSGTMLRFFKFVLDWKEMFGSLKGFHIIEIGVGFGGMGVMAATFFPEIASYTFVDLPEVLNLVEKYTDRAWPKNGPTRYYINAAPCNDKFESAFETRTDVPYDLVFSSHAFQELPVSVRTVYMEKILKRSKRGMFTDNIDNFKTQPLVETLQVWFKSKEWQFKRDEGLLILPDMMNLYRFTPHPFQKHHHDAKEALVIWGAISEYYEVLYHNTTKLVNGTSYSYPWVKLKLNAPLLRIEEFRKQL